MSNLHDKLERFRFMVYTYITEELLNDIDLAVEDVTVNISAFERFLYDQIAVSINFYLPGQRLSDEVFIQYPRDWWEAIKERFLPEWGKKRWPVRYTTVRMDIVAFRRKLDDPEKYRVVARVFEGSPAVKGVEYGVDGKGKGDD